MQTRENALHQWLKTIYTQFDYHLTPLTGDASFRRYYRLQHENTSRIVMDAPPDKLSLTPFMHICSLLSTRGLITPQIYASDDTLGFILLEDFGDVLFRDVIHHDNHQQLYKTALSLLHQMHAPPKPTIKLAPFDQAFMLQELALFHDWFLTRHLGLTLSPSEHQLLAQTFQTLTADIANQPNVLIHRDYHSRNIMVLPSTDTSSPKLGIIDFQDAMLGPITYDVVSLLKDCYVQLSSDEIMSQLQQFHAHSKVAQSYPFDVFQKAFDWCGLQRHLKVLGIFCRLHLRDGKPHYLNDLPRTYDYVTHCLRGYPEFSVFSEWLQDRIDPVFQRKRS
ncbi:MAG: phosphotransferase [Gammaproteobacteria bacterium]|nr:phosphotransferase [Gammaproteobacteria bacterium]